MLKIILIVIAVLWVLGAILAIVGLFNAPKEEDLWKK